MQKYIVVFCNSSPLTWDSCSHTRWCPSLLMASVCTTWWAMRGNGARTGGRCITPQRRNTTRYGRNIIEDLWLFQSVVRLKDRDCFFFVLFCYFVSLTDWSSVRGGQSEEGRVIHVPQGNQTLALMTCYMASLIIMFIILIFKRAIRNSNRLPLCCLRKQHWLHCIDPHRAYILYLLNCNSF